MFPLASATSLLVLSHLVPSAPGLRDRFIVFFGRRGFYLAYSIVSTVVLGFVIWAYRAADPGVWLYEPIDSAPTIAVFGMPVAVLLLVARLTTRPHPVQPHGIYRLVPAPGSLSLLLWCGFHLLNLGEARAVILFGAMAALAAESLVKNTGAARRQRPGSSVLPLLDWLRWPDRSVWREIGWWRVLLAAAVYAALLALHPIVIGPDPLAAV